jgi:hypothetical protein
MADIFREVEEDLRREQLRKLWDRFGIYIIVVAVAVIAVTGGWRGYLAWEAGRAEKSGEQFFAALKLAEQGDHAGAAAALTELAQQSGAGYRLVSRFRAASELARAGDTTAALAGFDALAADGSLAPIYRDLARVRAAYVALDTGDRAAVDSRAAALADGQGPWRQSAREATGLAAYAAGDLDGAAKRFEQIVGDQAGSGEFANRAEIMLSLIRGAQAPKAEAAAPDASGPEAAAPAAGGTKP